MRVRAPVGPVSSAKAEPEKKDETEEQQTVATDEYLDFSNGWVVAGIGYFICLVVLVANGYVLVTLILGEGS